VITKEQARVMTLGDIKSLKPDEFVLVKPCSRTDEEAHDTLVARFNELDPEFDTFLRDARPEILSCQGEARTFQTRVERMSPFELVHTWSVLTKDGIDDLEFITIVHRLIGRRVASVFATVPPPIQDPLE